MKTKIFITILASLPLVAGLTGCKSEEELGAKPAKEILIVEGGDIEIPASQKGEEEVTKEIHINADCAWTVSVDYGDFTEKTGLSVGYEGSRKLSVQPLKGKGNGTLIITADQNPTLMSRQGSITLTSDGGLKQKVNILQTSADAALTISKNRFYCTSEGSTEMLSIYCNTDWQIPFSPSWISLSHTSGSSYSMIILDISPNNDDTNRSDQLAIQYGDGNYTATIDVEQAGISNIELEVTPNELPTFTPEGGVQKVKVTSNAAWRAFIPSSAQSWLHISPDSGEPNPDKGNETEILVTCDPHEGTERDRMTVLIIVAGSKNPKQSDVIIQQSAAEAVETPGEDDNPDPQLSRKQ